MFSIWLNILPLTVARYSAQIEETSTFPVWLVIPLIILAGALVLYGLYYLFNQAEVIVGELEVATIFNKRTGDFKKFYGAGVHWINPLADKEGDRIYLGSQSVPPGTCEDLRTKEGIPVTIEFAVSCMVNPFDSLESIHYKMARTLPKFATNIVAGRVKHVLRHLVEQKRIDELYGEGAIKKLEDEVRAEVNKRSEVLGIKVPGPNDMKLGPVRMPTQVEKALKSDYERQLRTGTSIEALERLHKVVSQFEDKHMERLSELERLRVVESNGSLVYLMDSLVKGVRETAVSNGNGNGNGHNSKN